MQIDCRTVMEIARKKQRACKVKIDDTEEKDW